MNPDSFVAKVRSAVVDQNIAADRDLLESTTVEAATDPYWKRLLTLYHSVSGEQKAVVLEVMRQVRIDTVSEVFGILDGSSALEGPREDFVLTTRSDSQKINGDLQDLFLEADNRDRR